MDIFGQCGKVQGQLSISTFLIFSWRSMNLEDQFLFMPFFDNFKKLISKIMLPNSIVLA